MNLDAVTVRPDVTLEVVLRYLRMRGELPARTDQLFVVNRHDQYLRRARYHPAAHRGSGEDRRRGDGLRASKASRRKRRRTKSRSCSRTATSCPPPSSTSDGKLLGRITVDDVVDVIREEADHSVMSMAGLTKTKICSPAS